MNQNEYLKRNNLVTFCNYVGLMNCERYILSCDGYGEMKNCIGFDKKKDLQTPDLLKKHIENFIDYSGFVILVEKRGEHGEYIINTGFMAYKGNVVNLKANQVKNVKTRFFDFDINEDDLYPKSKCSIAGFSLIKDDVMNDDNILPEVKELLKEN